MRTEYEAREAFVRRARTQEGVPYIWGGQDPSKGFDCSGFVCWLLVQEGVVGKKYDSTADGLWQGCAKVQEADLQPGDLVFYGKRKRVVHVMVVVSATECIGAAGGGSDCKTIQIAKARNAKVKVLPIKYRKDVVGYGKVPFPVTRVA